MDTRARTALTTLATLLLLAVRVGAETPYPALELELSITLDPIVQAGTEVPTGKLDTEGATAVLLEEARNALSGMIYGYRFEYTPSDLARGVEESFTADPLARIPAGDEALGIAGTRLEGRKLTVLFRYALSEEQIQRREAWGSSVMEKAAGEGVGNALLGYEERATSLVNALKESVRAHLRPRIANKPRQITGDIVLWQVDPTRVRSGEYHTRVVTRLRVASVLPYRVY